MCFTYFNYALRLFQHSWLRENEDFASNVRKDVTVLLRGPNKVFQSYFVASALSDIHSLLRACKKALSSNTKGMNYHLLFIILVS